MGLLVAALFSVVSSSCMTSSSKLVEEIRPVEASREELLFTSMLYTSIESKTFVIQQLQLIYEVVKLFIVNKKKK